MGGGTALWTDGTCGGTIAYSSTMHPCIPSGRQHGAGPCAPAGRHRCIHADHRLGAPQKGIPPITITTAPPNTYATLFLAYLPRSLVTPPHGLCVGLPLYDIYSH